MHLHTRLTQRFNAVIVPGVTSVSAASAAIATPLVAGDEVLSVLPGHVAGRRADPPARRRRRGRGTQTGPLVSRCAGSTFGVRPARRHVLRGAGQHPGTTRTAGRGRRRDQRAVLLAGHAAGRAPAGTAVIAGRHRRGGGPGPRRRRLDDAAEPTGAGRRDRSDRLRRLPGPRPGPRRSAAPSQRQHRRTRACATGLRAGRARPRGGGGVVGRSGRVRDGHRRSGRGQTMARSARFG